MVAVLGAQDDAAAAAFAKLGSSAAVRKPIRTAQLLEAIRRAIHISNIRLAANWSGAAQAYA